MTSPIEFPPSLVAAETINVYVFDESTGVLVAIVPVDKTSIERGYFDIDGLPDGKYTFVAWGDSDEDLSRSYEGVQIDDLESGIKKEVKIGVTTLSNFYMVLGTDVLPGDVEGDVKPIRNDFDDLFFAKAEGVDISSSGATSVPFKFVRNANALKVTINGLDKIHMAKGDVKVTRAENEPPLNVFILAKNGRYNYANPIDDAAPTVRYEYQYLDYDIEDGTRMAVYIKTMRLDVVRHTIDPVYMYIQDLNGHNLVEPIDVMWAILQTRDPETGQLLYPDQAAIDLQDEFAINIEVELTETGISLTIYVDDWKIVILEPKIVTEITE
jgi:hypothetical protein